MTILGKKIFVSCIVICEYGRSTIRCCLKAAINSSRFGVDNNSSDLGWLQRIIHQ